MTVSLHTCEICSSLPPYARGDLINSTGLPCNVFRLVRGNEPFKVPKSTCRFRLHCPSCGTWYDFKCEVNAFEWNIYLTRITPLAARSDMENEEQYARAMASAKNSLVSSDSDILEYSARAVAEDALLRNDRTALQEILSSPSEAVRKSASLVFLMTVKDLSIYEEELVKLLMDSAPSVSLQAVMLLDWATDRQPWLPERSGKAIVKALADWKHERDGARVLRFMERLYGAGVDITPAVPLLRRFAGGPFEEIAGKARSLLEKIKGKGGRKRNFC